MTNDLLDFIEQSPSPFHVIQNLSKLLADNGFIQLKEEEKWNITPGSKYFVTRNSSSIISFVVPEKDYEGFNIAASHSDSPSFKIKENPEIKSEGCVKLNVEKYGGMLCAPWYDRPLSVAGRVITKQSFQDGTVVLKQTLVNIDKDLLMIPNLAIHMNRDANTGIKYNVQSDMLPVLSLNQDISLLNLIADKYGLKREDIISHDLFLYNRVKGSIWGGEDEFVSSTKLDDLECAWTTIKAFIAADNSKKVMVHCVFDNEEVGSETRQGAASTFLHDTLVRINHAMGKSEEDYLTSLAKSFMVSADNAHAVHPNYSSIADPVNKPKINSGIVIKFNAAQKYTSDAFTSALFKSICSNTNVPYQIFTNNSNVAGGSTLGNISNTQVSIPAVDIGLAQWAMHSPYETAGVKDIEYMYKAVKEFYKTSWILK